MRIHTWNLDSRFNSSSLYGRVFEAPWKDVGMWFQDQSGDGKAGTTTGARGPTGRECTDAKALEGNKMHE